MPQLGEKLSKESIDKMKASKLSGLLSKYDWVLADPYLDIEIKNGAAKRTTQYITLREFKTNSMSGLSIKDMILSGVSKNVLQFFSNFCQGKIKLIKEQLEYSYKQGMSLDEISKEFSVTREDLTCLRQLYDIKRRGATYINRKKTEEKLTQRQREIIYGSLMGDAKRQHSRSCASVGFTHGSKQENYLKWKHMELENLCSQKSLKFYPSNDDRKEFKGHVGSWRFHTLANTYVENILKQFYEKDKQITREILDNLTDLSLAVWYMDDGYADRSKYGISNFILCTDSYSEESVDNIVQWFDEEWGIKSYKRERKLKDRVGYRIVIKSESKDKFIDLIRPHIIDSMKYKIGEKK